MEVFDALRITLLLSTNESPGHFLRDFASMCKRGGAFERNVLHVFIMQPFLVTQRDPYLPKAIKSVG